MKIAILAVVAVVLISYDIYRLARRGQQ